MGELDIGKTSLYEKFAVHVSAIDGMILLDHCYEEDSFFLPHLAFVEAMRS